MILVNGASVGCEHRLIGSERVAVYPVFERLDVSSVTRLRPEASHASASAPAPAAKMSYAPARTEDPLLDEPPLLGLDGGGLMKGDFDSPFEEDELDVPTFLRRSGPAESDEEAEEPAFRRRSAD